MTPCVGGEGFQGHENWRLDDNMERAASYWLLCYADGDCVFSRYLNWMKNDTQVMLHLCVGISSVLKMINTNRFVSRFAVADPGGFNLQPPD